MATERLILPLERVVMSIHEVRGQRVILDADLARIYGVTTKRLNEAIKRNRSRFPADFAFRLACQEVAHLRSQIATSRTKSMRSQFATASKRNVRHLPWAFTEHGAIMAATILNSPQARRTGEEIRLAVSSCLRSDTTVDGSPGATSAQADRISYPGA